MTSRNPVVQASQLMVSVGIRATWTWASTTGVPSIVTDAAQAARSWRARSAARSPRGLYERAPGSGSLPGLVGLRAEEAFDLRSKILTTGEFTLVASEVNVLL